MKINEATEILKSIGWKTYTEEGERVAHFKLPDRTVQIIYDIKRFTNDQKIRVTLSLSTDEFSSACSQIRNQPDDYMPFIRPWNWPGVTAPEIREEHIHQASQQAIDWAKEQDLHQGLIDLAALPTDAFGLKPLWHIAALALLGDIDKLKFYQSSFEAGDRLGFEDYITKDYIDRAVTLAEQNATTNQ